MTGVDRDAVALADLKRALGAMADVELIEADIEDGPWPLAQRRFAAVVVTNYLWRPLLPLIVDCVDEGGVLLYETFAVGQETVGRPSRAEFLLKPGELLQAVAGPLRVVGYEDGFLTSPDRFVQRVAAVRPRVPEGASPWRVALPEALPGGRTPDR